MERFTLTAELVTPAIVNTLTLDGLLGAILFDDLQDVDKAHAAHGFSGSQNLSCKPNSLTTAE